MAKELYLIILAAVAGVALFFAGAYVLDHSPNDEDGDADDMVTITLTVVPSDAGTFTWSIPGMAAPKNYNGPFQIKKTDDLTMTASPETGYRFEAWFDGQRDASRNVGTHTGNTEYTAYFLTVRIDDMVTIILTIQEGLEVEYHGKAIESGVPFYVPGDADLLIKLPDTGTFTMTYKDPNAGGEGTREGSGNKGDVLPAKICVSPEWSGDVTVSITFVKDE